MMGHVVKLGKKDGANLADELIELCGMVTRSLTEPPMGDDDDDAHEGTLPDTFVVGSLPDIRDVAAEVLHPVDLVSTDGDHDHAMGANGGGHDVHDMDRFQDAQVYTPTMDPDDALALDELAEHDDVNDVAMEGEEEEDNDRMAPDDEEAAMSDDSIEVIGAKCNCPQCMARASGVSPSGHGHSSRGSCTRGGMPIPNPRRGAQRAHPKVKSKAKAKAKGKAKAKAGSRTLRRPAARRTRGAGSGGDGGGGGSDPEPEVIDPNHLHGPFQLTKRKATAKRIGEAYILQGRTGPGKRCMD